MSQRVVITGASTGIGQAAAITCLRAGHSVVATARQSADLERLSALGAEAVALELTDGDSISAAAHAILGCCEDGIDVLFNNAGYGLQVALEDASPEALRRQLDTNVIGPVALTNALLGGLHSGSRLVFNSSVLGECVVPFRGPYCMSKFALEAAADAYRLELASRGVGVHVLQPGPIEAQFRANALSALEQCLGGRPTRLDYRKHLARLRAAESPEGALPAAAVAQILLDIVEGRSARPRYPITRIARGAMLARRLSRRGFDRLALRSEPLTERP